jgi:hypothetical protein
MKNLTKMQHTHVHPYIQKKYAIAISPFIAKAWGIMMQADSSSILDVDTCHIKDI